MATKKLTRLYSGEFGDLTQKANTIEEEVRRAILDLLKKHASVDMRDLQTLVTECVSNVIVEWRFYSKTFKPVVNIHGPQTPTKKEIELFRNDKVAAIKRFRNRTGFGLSDSKERLERAFANRK